MRTWSINCVRLTDDTLFEIEAALPPAKDLGDRFFAFKRAEYRVAHCALLQVNFAAAPARLKCETPAALTKATHLQDFSRGKLVQIPDQRVTRIDSFRRCAG